MSEYRREHYKVDDDGNFETKEELKRAVDNGDLDELPNGNYMDSDTKEEFWPDGTKRE